MTCHEFHQVLPEIVDGGSAEQLAHLRSCSTCSELVSDLKAISQQARLLQASEEPSPRLWNSLEIALREKGLIRQPQREPRLTVVPASRRWSRAWLLPVAAALLVVFGLVLSKRSPIPPQVGQQASSFPGVGTANPTVAVSDKEDQQLLEMVGSRTPALRTSYENELRDVNAYIRDAEQSVQTDPNDEEAQQTLMEAYGQKAVVYEMAMDRSLP